VFAVLIQVLPFFALVGIGYGAGRSGFFGETATAALTKFVFYFALSAMILKFSAGLDLASIFDWPFFWAYLLGTSAVYVLASIVALLRRRGIEEAAVEGQCAVIGNTGFLGLPMLMMLMGQQILGPLMIILTVDLVVFSSLIVILITAHRDGRVSPRLLGSILLGLLKNPMIVSIVVGLGWGATDMPVPGPVAATLDLLADAATPGALFAIGASLASKSAERMVVAGWLSFAKLVLHPLAVGVLAFGVFPVAPEAAKVMVASAALPVAGNVYMLAQHYGVAPQRASTSILISTIASIVTFSAVITWLGV